MSATQAALSEQFIDVMGPMMSDAKAVDSVFAYIRLLRNAQNVQAATHPYSQQEINHRLDQSEEAFAANMGIPEPIARQHRHNYIADVWDTRRSPQALSARLK